MEENEDTSRRRRRSRESPPFFEETTPSVEDGMRRFPYWSISNPQTPGSNRAADETDFSSYISESLKLDDGPPARYQLRTNRKNLNQDSRLRRFTVGNKDPRHQNRTVLLVGATGSGKSTLINALVNFVMGVKFEDKVWFEIVTDKKRESTMGSQTSAVSVYEVFGFEGKTLPYSLTIIDTPGYGDTRGIEYDNDVTKLLQDLFCVDDGLDTIDAVGLVLKATENTLDERMSYIFNSVTSLFGKIMEQNIVALITHSDGRKPKQALQALDEVKVQCARKENNEPVYFRFNNCQKEKIEDEEEAERAQMDFKMSNRGMRDLTEFLQQCHPRSLKTTMNVMTERTRLTACVQNLEERVQTIERKQKEIERNKEQVLNNEEAMKKNQNFTIYVEEVYRDKEIIPGSGFWGIFFYSGATVCNKCKENCHFPGCTVAWGPSSCEVMRNGRCTSCSGKCPVEDHVKEKWKYVDKKRILKKTYEEMKAKYEENKTQREETTTLVKDLEMEMAKLQEEKITLLNETFQRITKLEQIALKADSVFTYVHLEFLMEKMKESGQTEKFQTLKRMIERMDDRNKAAVNYFRKCTDFVKKQQI